MQNAQQTDFLAVVITVEEDTVITNTQAEIGQCIMTEPANLQTVRPRFAPKLLYPPDDPKHLFTRDACHIPVPDALIGEQECVGHVS